MESVFNERKKQSG